MEETVKLIECVRTTWQGEGVDSGKRFTLLRGKYCNKKCNFCDTLVRMRITQEAEYKISDIQKILDEERTGLMITGGECTIDRHFNDTVMLLNNLSYPIANVETNGFKLKELIENVNPNKPIKYIYSPKIFNSTDLNSEKEKTKELVDNPNVFIKIVYEEYHEMIDYLEWLSKLVKDLNTDKVWLMPEGVTRADLIRNSATVMDACEKYRFNFSSRDHVIYGYI